MKNISILLGLMVILSGCAAPEKEELPTNNKNNSFIIVNNKDENFIEYKHIVTGCHYVKSRYNNDYFTQMFIEKNGVNVPFCD